MRGTSTPQNGTGTQPHCRMSASSCSKPHHCNPSSSSRSNPRCRRQPTPSSTSAPPPPPTDLWHLEGVVVKEEEGAQHTAKGKKEEVQNHTGNPSHRCVHDVLSTSYMFRALSFYLSQQRHPVCTTFWSLCALSLHLTLGRVSCPICSACSAQLLNVVLNT